jgi:hypothetical protein
MNGDNRVLLDRFLSIGEAVTGANCLLLAFPNKRNALCPSFMCQTLAKYPARRHARRRLPNNVSWSSRMLRPLQYNWLVMARSSIAFSGRSVLRRITGILPQA